jgi:hypothetical protein
MLMDRSSLSGSRDKEPEITISELHPYFTVMKKLKYAFNRK